MSVFPLRKPVLALGLTALVLPMAVHAQAREVVSKEVSVGRAEATLRLEFADEETFEIRLENNSEEDVEIRVAEHLYRWHDYDIVFSHQKIDFTKRGVAIEAATETIIPVTMNLDPGKPTIVR